MRTIAFSRKLQWVLTLLALASLASMQNLWDTAAAPYKKEQKRAAILLAEPALPSVAALRALSLNQRGAVADLLWLQSIQYFGQGNPYGKYPSLGKIMDTVTSVDPQFEYPYEFGMIVLPFMDQTDTAVKLGLRAQEALPNHGLLSFYLGSTYHLNVKDYKKAAFYYDKASTEPDGPGASKELAGVALASVQGSFDDHQAALAFWKTVYENAKTPEDKERAARWFGHLQIVSGIEIAAQQFKANKGRFPVDLEELRSTGFISSVPDSPINRIMVIDPDTGVVDYSKLKPGA